MNITDIIDRLFNEKMELFESEGFDSKIVGIRILGQDRAKLCNSEILKAIKLIISEEIRENQNIIWFHT
jgi:predicted nucleotidyltransferase